MTSSTRGLDPLCLAFLVGVCLPAQPVLAETMVSTNADSRLLIAFDAPDAAVAATVPDGWTSAPFGGGPFAGADFIMVFVDAHQYLDAQGLPKNGGRYRGVAMVSPAKAEGSDETVFFVSKVYINDAAINPYKNSVEADVSRQVLATGKGGEPASARESWSVAPETGGEIALSVAYQRSMPARGDREIEVRSSAEPDFYRIYRYTQYADLLMSVPAEVDRVESLALDVSTRELGAIFDGSEQLVGVLSLPWYMRETFLP